MVQGYIASLSGSLAGIQVFLFEFVLQISVQIHFQICQSCHALQCCKIVLCYFSGLNHQRCNSFCCHICFFYYFCKSFSTEGLSASGSITQSRDPEYQAVFSLRGKPLNSYGLSKKVVYENEEFNLLQAALNIEDGLEDLRYNRVIVATDADVDGMHIRLLIITFFLQFFPELIRENHVFILQTPLFRVRDRQGKEIIYCYDERERNEAMKKIGKSASVTRFKGLGEIKPEEFGNFIGENMRLDPVVMKKEDNVPELLKFYMGTNSRERQDFIVDNLETDDI